MPVAPFQLHTCRVTDLETHNTTVRSLSENIFNLQRVRDSFTMHMTESQLEVRRTSDEKISTTVQKKGRNTRYVYVHRLCEVTSQTAPYGAAVSEDTVSECVVCIDLNTEKTPYGSAGQDTQRT